MVSRVADELLADTRGYHSRDWDSFIYVIYETTRVKPEVEWKNLLRECGIDDRISVIVISGEPLPKIAHARKNGRALKSKESLLAS